MGVFLFGLPFYFFIKERSKRPIYNALSVAATTIILLLLLYWLGYNYVKSFFLTLFIVEGRNIDLTFMLYLQFFLANIMAFIIYLGIPSSSLLFDLKTHRRIFNQNKELSVFESFAIIIFAISNLTLLGILEQERVLLFLVPLFILPISKIVIEKIKDTQFTGFFYCLLFASYTQTWIFQLTMDTKW